ncbi:hypothetical protein Gotri_023725 [Gossypium trilobum]|uniref:Uncharacterized protein n=1 Tax=Gossypium trilobum TaxID=34281 RepID=A0A7J9DJX4_9ROSI|nr:hypothetical protein [Gossypium trilobum]
MKQNRDEIAKKFKVLTCTHSVVSDAIFTRTLQQNRLLAVFFRPIAAFLSAAKTIHGARPFVSQSCASRRLEVFQLLSTDSIQLIPGIVQDRPVVRFGKDGVVRIHVKNHYCHVGEASQGICIGMTNFKHPFLWIVRPDIMMGDSAILDEEFLEEIKDRGLITSWCNQYEVLSHPSVGVFLTHCGWNSTLKAILRENIEFLVKEVMERREGKKMKENTLEWKKKAEEATGVEGLSYCNFDKFVKEAFKHG